jgi:hypothetical protein
MTSPAEPDPPEQSEDDQLASLLDASLGAEQEIPASAASSVQSAPEHPRTELEQLVALGRRLRSIRPVELSQVVRRRLRARILAEITKPDP